MVDETLIREAILRASPETLDDVLAAVEAYRTCAGTARKLVRNPSMETHRQQVLECAVHCEEKLAIFARSGRLDNLQFPPDGMQFGHFVLSMKW